MQQQPSPWWAPSRHEDRRPRLLTRARIKAAIRAWFQDQGFVEVETGCLQASPGNETHLHAFRTRLDGTDLRSREFFLHTSPEFACKKLLAAGEERIFTFAQVFRNRERGDLHAAEFTLLEWYRAHAGYERLWDDCAQILSIAVSTSGLAHWTFKGRTCRAAEPPIAISVEDAFRAYAGIDLADAAFAGGVPDRDRFVAAAMRIGIATASDDTWSDVFSRVLTACVEPRLGHDGPPALLHAYPLTEAALARPSPADPRVAERFELYACGVELANGFGELNDAAEQRRRFEAEMAEKQSRYGERYPLDEDFLAALAQMPAASGCALGFDRLVMLATGASRVEDVIWTPMPA